VILLCLASVVLGSGFMLMHVGINNAVGHVSTVANRTQSFTLLALGFSTSSVLGPVIAGFTIDHAGHVITFALLAAFPLIALAMLLLKWRGQSPHIPHALPPGDAHVMDLLRDAPMRAVFIVSGLLSISWDMFTFMVPVQGSRIGLTASSIGIIMGTFGVATFIVRLGMPWLSKRLSEWQTLAFALGVTAFVYLLFPLFTDLTVLLAFAFVLGLGLGSAQPMVMSLIHRVAPAGRTGEAVGVRTSLLNTSQVFLPLLFGGLSTAAGMVPAFWIVAAILSAGGVYAGKRKGLAA
jgi:predicted MFS family arabinose efflux permease